MHQHRAESVKLKKTRLTFGDSVHPQDRLMLLAGQYHAHGKQVVTGTCEGEHNRQGGTTMLWSFGHLSIGGTLG